MKTAIITVAVIIASLQTSRAQISVNMPIGYSSLSAPTIGLNLQGNIGRLVVSAGFDNHLSKDKMKGNLIWSRVGGNLPINEWNSIEVTGGIGQHRISTDDKSLNKTLGVVNVQYVHQMASRPEAALFASITGTQKFTMFTGGLRFVFGRQSPGCSGSRIR